MNYILYNSWPNEANKQVRKHLLVLVPVYIYTLNSVRAVAIDADEVMKGRWNIQTDTDYQCIQSYIPAASGMREQWGRQE